MVSLLKQLQRPRHHPLIPGFIPPMRARRQHQLAAGKSFLVDIWIEVKFKPKKGPGSMVYREARDVDDDRRWCLTS